MLVVPRIAPKLLTNEAYGAPPFNVRGRPRRMAPTALACIHITDNPKDPPASATAERNYANREGSGGPSAHFYIDRSGVAVQAIDWREFPAWSNGDVKEPDVAWPGVQKVVDLRAKGFNANECYGVEIENCGREPEYPITDAQIRTNAYLVALARLEWPELPIDRSTVHPHRVINTVDKFGCPSRSAVAIVDEIIATASDYFEVMALAAERDELLSIIASKDERIKSLLDLSTAQEAVIESLKPIADREPAWIEYRDGMRSDAGASLARKAPVEDPVP